MSSTTPSATRNFASSDELQVEVGRLWSCGRDSATFLISLRSGSVKVGGRPPEYLPPEYLGISEAKPCSLRLWGTARARPSEGKA
jgi:hypothetical protein